MNSKNKPRHEIRIGRVKATIWANETENGTRYNVQIVRVYKDGEDWKEINSYGRDQLLVVAKISDMAHTWVIENN